MWGGSSNGTTGFDGVKGTITNSSAQRILVRTVDADRPKPQQVVEAILEPGGEMPYVLKHKGTLQIFKAPEGQAIGDPVKLLLDDPDIFSNGPKTEFTPAGRDSPVNVRTGWKVETSAYEIWGSTTIWLKRELDGWTIPASQKFIDLYNDPNSSTTSDYVVFTIRVESL
jgi:hypothetical protein